ncbi:MAG: trypsin-like serine protease [Bdellovibrio sp.]|nr:trypsin-like serine protease [Bdellovibrio sp.]
MLSACTPSSKYVDNFVQNGSIIGGEPVLADESIAKSTVAILATVITSDGQMGRFLCTGSIIAPKVVMTAAHCVPGNEYGRVSYSLIFGTNMKTGGMATRKVAAAKVHPNYGDGDRRLEETIKRLEKEGNPTGEGVTLSDSEQGADNNDIALFKIDGDLPAGFKPAEMLTDDTLLKPGTAVTLAGYGTTSVKKTPVDPAKFPDLDEAIASGKVSCNYAKTTCFIIRNQNENILKKTMVQVTQNFGATEVILDQSQGKGACHGDSGGPAFLNVRGVEYLWGVTSRGSGKDGIDDCSDMSIYTKANDQLDFINSTLKEWGL